MADISDYRLRTMEMSDAGQVLSWRNSDRVRANMYTDHIISSREHEAWFAGALQDQTARHLIFEAADRAVGYVAFTGINALHNRCLWGFYLGETDVPRGTGAIMEYLALQYAFEELQIRKLCCEVFSFNAVVVKMHEKFGFVREGTFTEHYLKNGRYEDIICLALFRTEWDLEKGALKAKCFRHGA